MKVYLGLGSNLGNREETINRAVEMLSGQIGPLVKRSSFNYSEPWGFDSANDFCNICASFETQLSPEELLLVTQDIEKQLGRTQKSVNKEYHDRTIDIDILIYEGVNMCTEKLTIPHPEMAKRAFVMVPLSEIMQENA